MIGHLGTRVSALLDGQLSPADEERAWDHVHSCHQCRDAVEREGWVKTRLATMQLAGAPAPSHLKGSLLVSGIVGWPDLPDHPALVETGARRRHLGMTGIGGGAVGAAVMGVLALGASPANAPGAVVRPSTEWFGSTLTHTITTVIDRDRPASTHGRDRRDAPPTAHGRGRRLAP
ncbi:MAG TPA: hypothetical protein VGK78_10600 [Nocardioides sp.]|uniref:hypothetical protein n=1 Tax=Nocardioides sp. TaxID=35761 RepID=UPI002F3E2E1A